MTLVDRLHLARPSYGSPQMTAWLAIQGHIVYRSRIQRQLRIASLGAIYQRLNTSKPVPAQKIHP